MAYLNIVYAMGLPEVLQHFHNKLTQRIECYGHLTVLQDLHNILST